MSAGPSSAHMMHPNTHGADLMGDHTMVHQEPLPPMQHDQTMKPPEHQHKHSIETDNLLPPDPPMYSSSGGAGGRTPGSRHHELTLSERVNLIVDAEDGMKVKDLKEKYRISNSSIYRILSKKNAILLESESNGNPKRKRHRLGKEKEIGDDLLFWYHQEKLVQGGRVKGNMLRAKAAALAKERGSDFVPSDGWLTRWKRRHNIGIKKKPPRKNDPDGQAAAKWRKDVLSKTFDYSAEDIFSCSEMALFYKGFPDPERGFKAKVEPDETPPSPPRITVLLCANMTGQEKRPLLVIGKHRQPKSFPHDSSKLPGQYTSSPNTMMMTHIFFSWLCAWDQELEIWKRKVVLLLDSNPAHAQDIKLSNIKLVFLPSVIVQPLELGVIKAVRTYYRKILYARIVEDLEADKTLNTKDAIKNVTVLNAIHVLKDAWENYVGRDTIENCFLKGGFGNMDLEVDVEEEYWGPDDIEVPPGVAREDFEEYLNFEGEAGTSADHAELLEAVAAAGDTQNEDPVNEEEESPLTTEEKLQMVRLLRRFVEENGLTEARYTEIQKDAYAQVSKPAKKERPEDRDDIKPGTYHWMPPYASSYPWIPPDTTGYHWMVSNRQESK